VVCMETKANQVLSPCFHLCMCAGCLDYYKDGAGGFKFTCPLCRGHILAANQVFLT
jgi:hypothetical protein